MLDEILRDDRSAEHGIDIMSALNATQLNTQVDATQGGAGGAGPGAEGGALGALSQAQTQSVAKMTKTEKENTLKSLVKEGWLKRGEDEQGRLKLGVRSFMVGHDTSNTSSVYLWHSMVLARVTAEACAGTLCVVFPTSKSSSVRLTKCLCVTFDGLNTCAY